jgi:hypothetical protein
MKFELPKLASIRELLLQYSFALSQAAIYLGNYNFICIISALCWDEAKNV